MQPYDSEVGAGTFHTATILRSLGPDAWRSGADFSGASDPLLVNGNAYIATKHTLRIVSGADGMRAVLEHVVDVIGRALVEALHGQRFRDEYADHVDPFALQVARW